MSTFETKASCSTGSNVLSLDLQSDGNVSQYKTSLGNQTQNISDQEYPFERWDKCAQTDPDGLNEHHGYQSISEVERWVHQIPSSYKHPVSTSRRSSVTESSGTRKECCDASTQTNTQTNVCRCGKQNDKQRNVVLYCLAAMFIILCISLVAILVFTYIYNIVMKSFENQRLLVEENRDCQKEIISQSRDRKFTITAAGFMTGSFQLPFSHQSTRETNDESWIIYVIVVLGIASFVVAMILSSTRSETVVRNCASPPDSMFVIHIRRFFIKFTCWISQFIIERCRYDTQESGGEVMDGDMHKTTDSRSDGDGEICISEGNDFHKAGDTVLGLPDRQPALVEIELGVEALISNPSIDRLECEGQEDNDESNFQ